MKKFSFKKDEVQVLVQVVESNLMDLRMQIRETDNYDFKQMLKKRRKLLSKIKATLLEDKEKN